MERSAARLIKALIIVVLLPAGALGAIAAHVFFEARAPLPGGAEYVALGSSFAAGPGIGRRAPHSASLCMRSSANYAQLFAAARALDLTDATCAGATTRNLLEGGPYFQRPQIAAVRPHTRLVTITVGGNDVAYIGSLGAQSCRRAPGAVPRAWRRVACVPAENEDDEAAFVELASNYQRLVHEVRRRAPGALVVLVDYATVLPEDTPCGERLPLTQGEVARGRAVARRLAAVTEDVARHTGSLLVRASALTTGHDVCSANPWVFGFTFPATPFHFGPLFYHPTDSAMAVIARALDRELPPIGRSPGQDAGGL